MALQTFLFHVFIQFLIEIFNISYSIPKTKIYCVYVINGITSDFTRGNRLTYLRTTYEIGFFFQVDNEFNEHYLKEKQVND